MGIRRGVSLYSYQQAEFFGQLTWKDQLREVATNLDGADGIEIVSEANVPKYPLPPESFYYEWNNEMARWGLKAVTMDCYLDVLQFRDHVMTHAEAAERIKIDLRIAKKMGFTNIRLVHSVPHEAIERALPLAEALDIRMTNEIHTPMSIIPKRKIAFGVNMGTRVAEDIAFIQRTGTKHYGLQPDFGIFQSEPSRGVLTYFFRNSMSSEAAEALFDELMLIRKEKGQAYLFEYFMRNYQDVGNRTIYRNAELFARNKLLQRPTAQPEDLYLIAPYIFCIHGKFYEMSEVTGHPGQYEEASIPYEQPIAVLKAIGYDGYINSEYEGQRNQQDLSEDALADEVLQVRRHHEMLKRLIGA